MKKRTAKIIRQYGKLLGIPQKRLKRAYSRLRADQRAGSIRSMERDLKNLETARPQPVV